VMFAEARNRNVRENIVERSTVLQMTFDQRL
jgi:hypothetical protein